MLPDGDEKEVSTRDTGRKGSMILSLTSERGPGPGRTELTYTRHPWCSHGTDHRVPQLITKSQGGSTSTTYSNENGSAQHPKCIRFYLEGPQEAGFLEEDGTKRLSQWPSPTGTWLFKASLRNPVLFLQSLQLPLMGITCKYH